jgi:hypothetical protein
MNTRNLTIDQMHIQIAATGIGLHTGFALGTELRIPPLARPDILQQLYPLAKNKAGSLIAIWMKDSEAPDPDMPVAWLDSEGAPNGIFACSYADFLSLIPYSSGFIYDVLSWCNSLPPKTAEAQYDELPQHLREVPEFDRNACKEYLNLIALWGMQVSRSPARLITDAFRSEKKFMELMNIT